MACYAISKALFFADKICSFDSAFVTELEISSYAIVTLSARKKRPELMSTLIEEMEKPQVIDLIA